MRIATTPTLLLRLAMCTALLLPLGCGDDDRVLQDAALPDADTSVQMPDGTVPDGAAPDGMVEMCEPGLVDCGEGCTALAGDSAHCGACGNACPSGITCAVGRCDCEEPMKSCDGLCTDPVTDNNHCGTCGNVCREGDICLEGACVIDCEAPNQRCAGTESEFVCSNPQTDSLNCGVCGAACSSGAECVGGTCSCGEGQISCSGSCVDPATDANFCGNCLTSCGAEGVCMDGGCSTCGAGLTACGEVARCTDTDTSRLHCGECDNTCGAGAGCTDGACACLPGFTDCDGECAALLSDRDHCGGCGIDCGLGTCSAGSCICQDGAAECGAECAVLESDSSHCGACDNVCGAGELCRDSACLFLNATCETGTSVTASISIAGEDLAEGDPPPGGDGCGFGRGSTALFYAVTVPVGQRVTAAANSDTDLVVFVQNDCDDFGCAISSDTPEQVTVDNAAGDAERTFYVGVRGYTLSTGTFDIEFTYVTPVIADNASCAGATPISMDTTISGEELEQGGSRPSGEGCGTGSGPLALYYAVTVPVGQRVVATADTSESLVVFVQDACSDEDCAASSFTEQISVSNADGAADRIFYIGVRGSSTLTGTFDMSFVYSDVVASTNTNTTCEMATVLTEDITIVDADPTLGGDRPMGSECGFGSGATALYYEVTVPVGQRARVIADSSSDLVVFSLNACGDTDCIDSSDFPEAITVDNLMGTAPKTEYIGVRGYSDTTTGTFDISVIYTSPVVPTNTTCATATEVTADMTFSNQLTEFGGARPGATGCGNGSGTHSLYYSVTVPAGDRVVVQTSPGGDIVLYELATCGDAACVTSTDSSPETLTFTNSTAAEATHIFGFRPYGSFSTPPSVSVTFTYSTP